MKTNNPLLPEYFPESWAAGYGQDDYGLWQSVYLDAIELRFRWMPPGSFMMGSPEDEPQRNSNEGPQHEVTFKEGFWLAEITCTQELWQAVMKDNPSRFADDQQNPVEQVSRKNILIFIDKLNSFVPNLEIRLPSEAEWEYGCRAGTTTPFWFGEELDTDKANYDGNYPYNKGKKGEYRAATMPVRSFKANPWGLYQVHGNVWELCMDFRHDDYTNAPTDGRVWEGGNAEEPVSRGGSWFRSGRSLRSAYRHDWLRIASGRLGFRLARGPEKPGQAIGEETGRDNP